MKKIVFGKYGILFYIFVVILYTGFIDPALSQINSTPLFFIELLCWVLLVSWGFCIGRYQFYKMEKNA